MTTRTTDIFPTPGAGTFYTLVCSKIRVPSDVAWDGTTATYTFTPDLTAAEAVAFDDLVSTFHSHDVELSLTEYQAIKSDIALLKTFAGINTPTLAQTAAATKAQSRILRALLRDG